MAKNGVIGIDNLKKDLQDLKEAEITIGYQGQSGRRLHPEGSGATIAEVASYMEYGTADIPARPFLRTALQQKETEIRKVIKKAMADLIDQRADIMTAIAHVGDAAVEAVRDTIDNASAWAAPLAASTIKAKGSSNPLVDSGAMRDNTSWAYRKDGQIVKQGGEK